MGGTLSLLICLLGGTLYQQAPMRDEAAALEGKKQDSSVVNATAVDDEQESLLDSDSETSSSVKKDNEV
jgi:hypothetical protein